MRQINDRMGEVLVLASMAKSASESRTHYAGQCECQAIQLNKKCLELAKLIGCKVFAIPFCNFLNSIFVARDDEVSSAVARALRTVGGRGQRRGCATCHRCAGSRDGVVL